MRTQDTADVQFKADYIAVQGSLTAGTAESPFQHKLEISLTGSVLEDHTVALQDGTNVQIGHKAFVVLGGSVHLYGAIGTSSPLQCPPWVKVQADALKGDSHLEVPHLAASCWPIGSEVAIASTDFQKDHAERRRILNREQGIIYLDEPLGYGHVGSPVSVPGLPEIALNHSAEVAVLSRSIVIRGEAAGKDGGHLAVMFTETPSVLQGTFTDNLFVLTAAGVEFVNMGQQGLLGRCEYRRTPHD